jgi:hypothetical protein
MNGPSAVVPDSQHRGLVAMLPPRLRDFAQLARFDRPIGWWLLFWPCAWGVLLAGGQGRMGAAGLAAAGLDRHARGGLRLQRHRRCRSSTARESGAHRQPARWPADG